MLSLFGRFSQLPSWLRAAMSAEELLAELAKAQQAQGRGADLMADLMGMLDVHLPSRIGLFTRAQSEGLA